MSTGTSNPQLVSAEAIEMAYPVRIRRVELVTDSGGSGRFRGGLGIIANRDAGGVRDNEYPQRALRLRTARPQ